MKKLVKLTLKSIKWMGIGLVGMFLFFFILEMIDPSESVEVDYDLIVGQYDTEDDKEVEVEEVATEEVATEEVATEESFIMPANLGGNNVEVNRYSVNTDTETLVLDLKLNHASFNMAILGAELAVAELIEEHGAHEFEYIRLIGRATGINSLGDELEFTLISFDMPQRTIDAIYRNGRSRVNIQENVNNLNIHPSAQ